MKKDRDISSIVLGGSGTVGKICAHHTLRDAFRSLSFAHACGERKFKLSQNAPSTILLKREKK